MRAAHHPSPRRFLAVALSLLAGSCTAFGGLSNEESERLAGYTERAERYFASKDYPRASQQIEKGLKVDAYDYRLNQLRGQILLRQARSDPARFRDALRQFERVRGLRSDGEHDYLTFLGLGQANQGLYQLHRRRWREFQAKAGRSPKGSPERREARAKAEENLRLARRYLDAAERAFQHMVELGDGLVQARRYLFKIAADRIQDLEGKARERQFDEAISKGLAYLDLVLARKKHYRNKEEEGAAGLPAPLQIDLENEARRRRREYEMQEIECRGILHALYYHSGRYAKAIQHLDALIALDPTRAPEYYNRALCHYKLGHLEEASRDFQDFLRLTSLPFDAPKVREASAYLTRIEESKKRRKRGETSDRGPSRP